MGDQLLSIILIGFAALFLFIILGWGSFKKTFGMYDSSLAKARHQYNRLKGIHISYRIILIFFTLVSVIYFFIPESQYWLIPIHWLNNDYVNAAGIVILSTAFVLVLSNQLKLDKSLHQYYFDPAITSDSRLVPNTEKNLLKSILLVYLGIFVVVSTVATAILLFISLMIYYLRSADRKYRIKTPMSFRQPPSL